ncbi:restriction endonuclease subunit S [Glaciimonas sp. PCH181]|nr:restriction endonuclease subunit S [Glaciimonas sp. PCH181]
MLTEHIDIWTAADSSKKSGRGRASSNVGNVYGIRKLRELILELAVRGKLVPQDANDEPASELLKRIRAEKSKLIAEGKIKKDKPSAPITDLEKPFKLPEGWEWIRLNELLSKIGAGSTPLGGKQVYVDDGVPFLRSQNVWNEGVRLDDVAFIKLETHQKMLGTHVFSGDLLFNITGASIGRCAIVPDSLKTGNVSQHVTIVRPVSKEILLFLHLVLISRHVQKTVMDVQVGVSREGLSIGKLGQFIIPIPPISEQLRIVAKVDELMALCDRLEAQHTNAAEAHEKLVSHLLGTLTLSQNAEDFSANWQRIAVHFDTLFTTETSIDALKQTLLQLAVMGKLVPQDPKDEPASELLKQIQAGKAKLIADGKIKKSKPLYPVDDKEKPFSLPIGWKWIRLSEVAELITSGSRDWAQHLSVEGAKFVTMANLSRGSYNLRLENMRYVNAPKDGEGSRTKLEANDLLISITGYVGNLGRIPDGFGDAYINQHTCLLRFIPQCRNRYFPEGLRSPMASLQFNAPQRGIKNSFRLSDVDEMIIPLPPRNEQLRIVSKIDELMALCDQLKSFITEANQLQQKIADVMIEQAVA